LDNLSSGGEIKTLFLPAGVYRITRALNCVGISVIRMSSGGWVEKRRKRSEKHGTMSACLSMCWRKSGKKIRHTALSRWIFSGDRRVD
jgi:hypothetical protein